MTFCILVTYASKYGATAEIARKIGDIFTRAGITAYVLPAERVRDVSAFDAVVLGSAVYQGHWRAEAVKFLEDYKEPLSHIPVWLFSSGPTGAGNPVDLAHGWHFPSEQEAIVNGIHARDVALFNGVLDMDRLNRDEKRYMSELNAPVGDFRNWEAINSWAVSIIASLRPEVAE